MITTTLIIASTLLAAPPQRTLSELQANAPPIPYEWHQYRFMTNGGPKVIACRLFVPRSTEPKKRYPLLVWLEHTDAPEWSQLKRLFGPDYAHLKLEKYPFFILLLPWERPLNRYVEGDPQVLDAYLACKSIQKTTREHPIDPDRVYLAGTSRGAVRSWEMAMRYPELFAALVPMGSPRVYVPRADKLKAIPIWAFHNSDDKVVPADGDLEMTEAVKNVGGTILLTLPPSREHDCCTTAFQKYDVMAWMLEQRRGAVCWTPPGYPPWKWWHILLLPCAALGSVRLVWHFRQKRR